MSITCYTAVSMPSPERRSESSREQEPVPYHLAARFDSEQSAGRAYFEAQESIFSAEQSKLSAYRFQFRGAWHVALLGDPPTPDLDRKLKGILDSGEFTSIPDEALKLLAERRVQAAKHGEWVEGHYRPGKPLL